MIDSQLYQIWIVAAVLIGFQLTALGWRLSRESEPTKSNPSWLPPADCLNLLSIAISICTVFVLPTLGIAMDHVAPGLALSLILLAGYPFAMAGHYRLFHIAHPKERTYCTLQEAIAICLTFAASGLFMYQGHFFGPQVDRLNWLLPLVLAWLVLGVAVFQFAKSKKRATPKVVTMSWMFPPIVAGMLQWSKRSRPATAKAV